MNEADVQYDMSGLLASVAGVESLIQLAAGVDPRQLVATPRATETPLLQPEGEASAEFCDDWLTSIYVLEYQIQRAETSLAEAQQDLAEKQGTLDTLSPGDFPTYEEYEQFRDSLIDQIDGLSDAIAEFQVMIDEAYVALADAQQWYDENCTGSPTPTPTTPTPTPKTPTPTPTTPTPTPTTPTPTPTPPTPTPCVPHPPTFTLNVPTDVDEGEVFTIDGYRDGYIYDIREAEVLDWPIQGTFTGSWTATVVFRDDNPTNSSVDAMPIIVSGPDWCTSVMFGSSTIKYVNVHNLPPTISMSAPTAVDEGSSITVSLTIADPGELDTPKVLTVAWGDGTVTTRSAANGDLTSWGLVQLSHIYLDDNPTATPQDNYTITATITDDDNGTATATAPLIVNNVAPTVTITSIIPIDSVSPVEGGVSGRLDETEGFVVTGTVTDPGVLDTFPIAVLEVDLNFDGDVTDSGESLPLALTQVSTGTYTFQQMIAKVRDDGPWTDNAGNATWSNETVADELAIEVRVEDDDTGVGTGADTVLVWDVEPKFIDDPNDPDDQPNVTFQYDSNDILVSAIVNGTFTDPGDEDYHDIVIEWGDGGVSFERLFPGDLAFSIQRNFPSSPPSLEDLYPIVLYVSDDDTQLDAFVLANNDCDDVSLPAYIDKIPAATVARYGPWSPTGHLALTWNHFTPMPPPLQAQQPKLLAYSKSPFPASPVILGRVAVQVEHEGLIVPAGDEDAFKAEADPHWQKLREYKKSDDEAYLKAKEKFVKHTGEASKRCWITVVKFDPGEIDKIVQITLDQSLPNGTRVHSTNMAFLAAQPNGTARVAYILNHEQGHHDISEAYAKVLRAELNSMRFAVWSPVPKLSVPDVYRNLAANLLRNQALQRLAALNALMNNTQTRYDKQTKHGNLGNPHPVQATWDQALAQTLGSGESDPNAILVQPVEL